MFVACDSSVFIFCFIPIYASDYKNAYLQLYVASLFNLVTKSFTDSVERPWISVDLYKNVLKRSCNQINVNQISFRYWNECDNELYQWCLCLCLRFSVEPIYCHSDKPALFTCVLSIHFIRFGMLIWDKHAYLHWTFGCGSCKAEYNDNQYWHSSGEPFKESRIDYQPVNFSNHDVTNRCCTL